MLFFIGSLNFLDDDDRCVCVCVYTCDVYMYIRMYVYMYVYLCTYAHSVYKFRQKTTLWSCFSFLLSWVLRSYSGHQAHSAIVFTHWAISSASNFHFKRNILELYMTRNLRLEILTTWQPKHGLHNDTISWLFN